MQPLNSHAACRCKPFTRQSWASTCALTCDSVQICYLCTVAFTQAFTAGIDTVHKDHADGSRPAQLQGQVIPTAVQADDSDAAALLQLQGQNKTPSYQGIYII